MTVSRALTDRFLWWALAALLIFSPLAFGTVEVWAIAAAELLVLFMGSVWVARMISDGNIQFEATSLNAPIVLFLALIHSLTDFNLHIPANALTMVTVFGITFNAARVLPSGGAFDRRSEVL